MLFRARTSGASVPADLPVTSGRRTKQLTLVAATLGSFIALLDSSVVHVALPAIRDSLGGGLAGQQWVVSAYMLLLGSLILIGGSLSDLYGERRIFVVGTVGFGAASAACAASPAIEVLVASRALQGAFGALLTPASLAIIVRAFPPAERGRAIGTWTAFTGIAALVGPLVGGWFIETATWRWIFAINIPFAALTVAIARSMPARPPLTRDRRPDALGATLCAVGLAGPTFALARQPDVGWSAPSVILPLAVGAGFAAAFLWWEARAAKDPMLPLELFRTPNFRWANVATVLIYGTLSGMFFVLTLFLQQVSGYSALEAGLASLPTTVVMFLLSRRLGTIADRIGSRRFMAGGPLVCAVGTMLLLLRSQEEPGFVVDLLPGLMVFALGLSIVVAPLTATVLADVGEGHAGIASGVNNAVARLASLLATASIGVVVGGSLDVDGLRATLVLSTLTLALAGAVSWLGIRDPARTVAAAECAGGQFAGAPAPVAAAS